MTQAVRQGCFEAVEVGANDVGSLVDGQPGEMLTYCLPHHARFAMLHSEAFFTQYGCDVGSKSPGATFEVMISGKGEVVRIARVYGAGGLSQACETAIGAPEAEIRESRRCGSPLWQVWPSVERSSFSGALSVNALA